MQQSKLVKGLKLLTAWELNHFGDFIHSPFFNKHEKVRELVDHLLAQAPDFEGLELDKQFVHEKLFPDEPFQEQRFKNLLSQTVKLYRNFLAFYELKNNDFRIGTSLLDAYRDRSMEGAYQKQYKALGQAVRKRDEKLQEIHLKELELRESFITWQNSRMSRSVEGSIQSASDQLDTFYLFSKMKYGVEMANRQGVVAQEFDPGMLPAVLAHLQRRPEILREQPEIQIYLLIYRAFTEEDPDPAFKELMEQLMEHSPRFPRPEVREMYGYAANFCIRQVNKGKRNYLSTLFQLYKWALAQGAIYQSDGWLVQWDYKNIVSTSLKAGEDDWCRDFIEQYKERIAPEFRENAYAYNLASFHFEQQDYHRALMLLQQVEFSDVFYALGSRVILLKSYYEMGDLDALSSLCDAFKIYLKRNKTLSRLQFTIYFNLVGFAKKLADLHRKHALSSAAERSEAAKALVEKVKAQRNTAQAPWLIEKLQALT